MREKTQGFATIDPYEAVVFDAERAAKGWPPWRSKNGPDIQFYLDDEVNAMTDEQRAHYNDNGWPIQS